MKVLSFHTEIFFLASRAFAEMFNRHIVPAFFEIFFFSANVLEFPIIVGLEFQYNVSRYRFLSDVHRVH